MSKLRNMLTGLVVGLAALPLPASAQTPGGDDRTVIQRERDTNEALLAALLQRRADVLAAPGTRESKRHALEFLETRIAQARSRLGR